MRPGRAHHRRRDGDRECHGAELAATGANVVICGRREEPLVATAKEIEAAGGQCLALPADVREPEQVERVVNAALDRFGAINLLVNNAGANSKPQRRKSRTTGGEPSSA